MVYECLTGPRFLIRIEAIVENLTDMQDDLKSERNAIARFWAKREKQIHGWLRMLSSLGHRDHLQPWHPGNYGSEGSAGEMAIGQHPTSLNCRRPSLF